MSESKPLYVNHQHHIDVLIEQLKRQNKKVETLEKSLKLEKTLTSLAKDQCKEWEEGNKKLKEEKSQVKGRHSDTAVFYGKKFDTQEAENEKLRKEINNLNRYIANGLREAIKEIKEEILSSDTTRISVPKESITEMRTILSTLYHHVNNDEANKLIDEIFINHLGFTKDGFKHFTPEEEQG